MNYLGELRDNARPLLDASLGIGTSLPLGCLLFLLLPLARIRQDRLSRVAPGGRLRQATGHIPVTKAEQFGGSGAMAIQFPAVSLCATLTCRRFPR